MIWGNAWRVTGSPKSSPKSDRLSGANKLLGAKTGGTRRAARMMGGGREGGDGCFVHGSLVRGFRPGVGMDGRLVLLLQTRPRPEPTAYHQVMINCALPTDTDTD